jgi:hypothetical protein
VSKPSAVPKSGGSAVTDEQIDVLSRDAERGYSVDRLTRRAGRRPMGSSAARVVPVRLDPELDRALRDRAEADGSSASEVVRAALRAWLASA